MVLYLVGLGLGDEKDITVRGLETVRQCSKLYLEHYTSVLGVDKTKLEEFYGKPIILADRFLCESSAEDIYSTAVHEDVSLLVVGDPLCATTHTDMMLRARAVGARVEVIHNASVMAGVASCGLQLYQFGQTISVPFFDGTWRPDSWYDKLAYNARGKMHTLVLVDIKVKEPDFDAMLLNRTAYLPPRFMTVNQCVAQLLEVEAIRGEELCGPDSLAIGCARLGQPTQLIVSGTLAELVCVDFGGPLHSLVMCGELHELELAFMDTMRAPKVTEAQTEAAVAAATAEVAALVKASPAEEDSGDVSGVTVEEASLPTPPSTDTASNRSAAEPDSPVELARVGAEPKQAIDDDAFQDVFGVDFSDINGGAAVVSDSEDE